MREKMITENEILNKNGMEDIMAIDMNNQTNYGVPKIEVAISPKVVLALFDMGIKPDIYVTIPNYEYKDDNTKIKLIDFAGIAEDLNLFTLNVCEVVPRFGYIDDKKISEPMTWQVSNIDRLSMLITPVELKRVFLIFDQYKDFTNAPKILSFKRDVNNKIKVF